MVNFIGREVELKILGDLNANRSESVLAAVYGRRRVGKTTLIEQALQQDQVLKFEGLEGGSREDQQAHFQKTLFKASHQESHRRLSSDDWIDYLILLSEFVGKEPRAILFDEFQWMAADDDEFVSALKYVWDNYFSQEQQCAPGSMWLNLLVHCQEGYQLKSALWPDAAGDTSAPTFGERVR